jgi:F420-0:gamma-glutamyl ligase
MPSKPPQSKAQKKANRTAKKLPGHVSKKRQKKRLIQQEEDEFWENVVLKKKRGIHEVDQQAIDIASAGGDVVSVPPTDTSGLPQSTENEVQQLAPTVAKKLKLKKGQTKRLLKLAMHEKGII